VNSNTPIAGFRFADLVEARLVSSRSDLHTKQKKHGFPKPAKTSQRSAWWPDCEIRAWVQSRLDLRDAPTTTDDDSAASSPPLIVREPQGTKTTPEPAPAHPRKAASPNTPAARKPPARKTATQRRGRRRASKSKDQNAEIA
jgi:predicted DNA-binding transcriptional regulator AlpA